jgi:hypothetical protein
MHNVFVNKSLIFYNMINEIICNWIDQVLVIYINDILIYSTSQDDHEKVIKELLSELCIMNIISGIQNLKFNNSG